MWNHLYSKSKTLRKTTTTVGAVVGAIVKGTLGTAAIVGAAVLVIMYVPLPPFIIIILAGIFVVMYLVKTISYAKRHIDGRFGYRNPYSYGTPEAQAYDLARDTKETLERIERNQRR